MFPHRRMKSSTGVHQRRASKPSRDPPRQWAWSS
jgi:hypothetical protein